MTTSWHDIADQLTAAQIAELQRLDWPAHQLLMGARYYAALNCEHLTGWPQPTPPPPGW
ncbi:hypothetical protein [Mycolicibacterium sp. 120270]|uniref:hypothetical protein n=1 Tax=Mycolicibacterium sp. 120270 TaxID=3090600 RepID=UPI00299E8EBE|nr:hypothetical protein [Mycolicibacterium sp. 120270]MDX1885823.1 hypothetical protein [Mycolicibacterium sp. 120270]